MAGVSVRTLHHYDETGLLKPARRAESGYRYYGKAELLRLQQILFYKELDYPLTEIKQLLDDPEFDLIRSLNFHKAALQKRQQRMTTLLQTIEKTIVSLKKQEGMITDEEMYAGFPREDVPKMKEEVASRWGQDKLDSTENNIRQMSKQQWAGVKQEGEDISLRLSHKAADSREVQEAVQAHYQYMCQFHAFGEEGYRGLGQMYVNDERFRAHYDQYRPGLADFLNSAIQVFCNNGMKLV